MGKRSCLIAGLPESGKSTFLGALWFNLRRNKKGGNMCLTADSNLPDDIAQLNKLSDAWRDAEDIDRTSGVGSIERVKLNLVRKGTNEKITLEVPDFRGEVFKNLLTFGTSDLLNKWLSETDSLLYFIKDFKNGDFDDDELHDHDEDISSLAVVPPLTVEDISPAAQNIMVLKYLLSQVHFKKVIIMLSCWDLYTNNGKSNKNPEIFLRQNSPGLYNYITHHISNPEFYGLSSQGRPYPLKKGDQSDEQYISLRAELKKELIPLTKDGKRAFVEFKDKIIFDLSLPLDNLIA